MNYIFTKSIKYATLTDMNEEILQEAGLTNSEAKIYILLVKNSPCPPPRLADMADESRTNTYKLLDSLEEKNLVTRDDTQKKLRYWANNPSNLLDTLKKKRAEVETAEKRFQGALPTILSEYLTYSDQPLVRYFNGRDEIRKIYDDQLSTGEAITFIHSAELVRSFGIKDIHLIRNQFPARNIHRHVFYPDIEYPFADDEEKLPVDESDKIMQTSRTWLHEGDYTAPVEWSVYSNKLSVVSLGTEFAGMIIESPQIAASFREILSLLDRKLRAEPGYNTLPKKLLYTKMPEVTKKSRVISKGQI